MIPTKPEWEAYVWACSIALSQFLAVVLMQYHLYHAQIIALQLRSALTAIIYRKALRLSNRSRSQKTNGEIVNLMSIDAQKLSDMMLYIHAGWSGVLQVGVSIGMIFNLLGWPTVAGLGVLVLSIPILFVVIRIWSFFRVKNLKLSDTRLKSITEILQGISIISK